MDLCDVQQIRELLSQSGFRYAKSKGQNFLTARWVPELIAEESSLDENTGVLEIGTGIGCLTEQLALRAGKVISYELDERLRPVLAQTLASYNNIELFFGDVMRRDLKADTLEKLHGLRPVVCANLPYNITTPLLTQIYRARCFDTVTVMVQQEVAQRICAQVGSSDYSAFSLLTQWYAQPEILFFVGPECFFPKPKVTSAVVRMTMLPAPPVDAEERALFRVIRAAFNHRRKTLINALDSVYGKERAQSAVLACGFPEMIRGEALSLSDFAILTNEIEKN